MNVEDFPVGTLVEIKTLFGSWTCYRGLKCVVLPNVSKDMHDMILLIFDSSVIDCETNDAVAREYFCPNDLKILAKVIKKSPCADCEWPFCNAYKMGVKV